MDIHAGVEGVSVLIKDAAGQYHFSYHANPESNPPEERRLRQADASSYA
jgi:hypothetical protein